jgi:hypothetical protein
MAKSVDIPFGYGDVIANHRLGSEGGAVVQGPQLGGARAADGFDRPRQSGAEQGRDHHPAQDRGPGPEEEAAAGGKIRFL